MSGQTVKAFINALLNGDSRKSKNFDAELAQFTPEEREEILATPGLQGTVTLVNLLYNDPKFDINNQSAFAEHLAENLIKTNNLGYVLLGVIEEKSQNYQDAAKYYAEAIKHNVAAGWRYLGGVLIHNQNNTANEVLLGHEIWQQIKDKSHFEQAAYCYSQAIQQDNAKGWNYP